MDSDGDTPQKGYFWEAVVQDNSYTTSFWYERSSYLDQVLQASRSTLWRLSIDFRNTLFYKAFHMQ